MFYRYYTQVAEWFPYALCIALLLFGRVGDGCFATSVLVLSALTTQSVKHLINAPRPVTWFAANMPDVQLPLVDGVQMSYWCSFPSGHTTSFFALFFTLCIIYTGYHTMQRSYSAAVQLLLFIAATTGAYSRIYLSQHFAADVFGGIVVGIGITIICYAVFCRFQDKKWYNYRLLGRKSSKKAKK